MAKNVVRILLTLLSIAAGFTLPKKSFVKYLPVTLFCTSCLLSQMFYLTLHKLWKAKGGPGAMVCNTLVLMTGPYFFANLWVFHLTKGKLVPYSIINIVADFIYAFPVMALFKKLNFFKLKISSTAFYLMIVSNAFINYLFQMFYERATQKNKNHFQIDEKYTDRLDNLGTQISGAEMPESNEPTFFQNKKRIGEDPVFH